MKKQNSKLIINIPTELKEKLKTLADMMNVSLNSYCLFALSSIRPKFQEID